MARPRLKLYWVETPDHGEDWFIVARSKRDALRNHELDEGYGRGDASGTLVCAIPEGSGIEKGWPTLEQLVLCGAEIERETSPRRVRINGAVYCEGAMDAELDEAFALVKLREQGAYAPGSSAQN